MAHPEEQDSRGKLADDQWWMGDERGSAQILKQKMPSKKTGSHFTKRVNMHEGCWYHRCYDHDPSSTPRIDSNRIMAHPKEQDRRGNWLMTGGGWGMRGVVTRF